MVYNSSSLSGQIAAVESGLAVALYRSRASKESLAVGSLYESLLRTLRTSAADPFAYRDPEQR
ncbi:hypothetical protein [Raoultella terrigena]|uniref:hypothetical protein n=1 Tax=Raoultella terrigena TaxID=577 RepID=UPI001D0DBC71|nr:hypothetical protein [Raoultella terrigena]